jgi:hypothetical protein
MNSLSLSPVITLTGLALATYALYILCLFAYRLTLHPLAKFPGPRLAACSYWYEFYQDLIAGPFPGQGAYNTDRLHEKYGMPSHSHIQLKRDWLTSQQDPSCASVQKSSRSKMPTGSMCSTSRADGINGPRTRKQMAVLALSLQLSTTSSIKQEERP